MRHAAAGAIAALLTGFAIALVLTATAHGDVIPIEATLQDVRVGDVGPPGPSVGDTRSEVLYLWNRRIRATPIGNAYMLCTTMGRGGIYGRRAAAMCDGIINMPRGKLLIRGIRRSNHHYTLQVVGGTRLYERAVGRVRVDENGPRFHSMTFLIDF